MAHETAASVIVRFRPKNAKETGGRSVSYASPTEVAFRGAEGGQNVFRFDRVFGQSYGLAAGT